MALRKWLIRGILLLLTLLMGGAYYVYGQYTNPEAVAQLVLNELRQHFPDAEVQLGHAEWRLFGGVLLNDLRVTPKEYQTSQPAAVLRQTTLKIDKASAAQGRFELQRVLLDQPQLNLERDEEGRWNVLSLLSAKPKASGTIPFVVLNKGTIRFHDKRLQFPILELTGVDAKLTPQPQGILAGEGQGFSSLLGPITFRFTHDPHKDSTVLAISIARIEYQPKLEEIIVKLIPIWQEQQIRVRGQIGLEMKLTWFPHRDIPLIESTLHLQAGEMRHPRLPVPLKNIQAALEYHPGALLIRSFSARAREGTIEGNGRVDLATDIRLFSEHQATLHLDYQNLKLDRGVYPSLPPGLRKFCEDYKTEGLINGSLDINWKQKQLGIAYTIKPHQGAFEADDFPYPANSVTGLLQYHEQGETPVLNIDLRGQFGTKPFTLKGQLNGQGLRPNNPLKPGLDLAIHAEGIPLDDQLYRALEQYPDTYKAITQFHASGQIDCDVTVRRDSGLSEEDRPPVIRWVKAQLKDVAFRFDSFPCPIEKVQAHLEVYPDKSWRITRFRGEHRGGLVTGQAWMVNTIAGSVLHIDMLGKQLSFTSELFAALPAEVQSIWRHFKPAGHADCKVTFDKLEKGKPIVDFTMTARGASIVPASFPYQLDNLRGTFRYAGNEVSIGCLTAEHGSTAISIDGGHVTLRPENGFLVQLQGINFDQVKVDEDLLAAMPPGMQGGMASLKPDKPLKVRLNLDIDEPGEHQTPRLGWNGSIEVNQCKLHCGTVLEDITGVVLLENGSYSEGNLLCEGQLYLRTMNIAGKQTIGPLHSKLLMSKDILQFSDCQASIPGGGVRGLIEIKTGSVPRFHIDLSADVRLEQFLQNSQGLKGRALGQLRVDGEGSNLRNLTGDGSIEIRQGADLYQLPLVIDIFNQFSQLLPKATNFQTAKVDFVIQGDRILAKQLQLLGDAYRVEGTGSAKIDGNELNLVLTLVLGGGRTLPLMPAVLDTMQKIIAKGLMKVKVTGSVSKVDVQVEPVPFITDPVKDAFRMVGR